MSLVPIQTDSEQAAIGLIKTMGWSWRITVVVVINYVSSEISCLNRRVRGHVSLDKEDIWLQECTLPLAVAALLYVCAWAIQMLHAAYLLPNRITNLREKKR